MRVVVQRSLASSVLVDKKIVGKIDKGLVLLVSFTFDDSIDEINYMVKKIVNLCQKDKKNLDDKIGFVFVLPYDDFLQINLLKQTIEEFLLNAIL